MKDASRKLRSLALHAVTGGLAGVFILHPASMFIRWIEQSEASFGAWSVRAFGDVLVNLFTPQMFPMGFVYFTVGAFIGIGFGYYHIVLVAKRRLIDRLERRLGADVPELIRNGENESTEFKSSLRWDQSAGKLNRNLETAVLKSIAGFANHRGGDLLIGIADDGEIVGLERDFATMKQENRDGFERTLMNLIRTYLGGDICALIHCLFYRIEDREICRIVVEPSVNPVYCRDGNIQRYYARAGNTTRELDAQEAVRHIDRRQTAIRVPVR